MTSATAQPLSFESEGNAGNTDENFRKTFAVENLRRRGRLEDSVRTARELGAIANAAGNDRARRSIYARIEDGASRRQRVSRDTVSRDFVADCGVEDDGGCGAVGLAREYAALDACRHRRRIRAGERVAACAHDRAKIFLFVRHSRRHGGSGLTARMRRAIARACRCRSRTGRQPACIHDTVYRESLRCGRKKFHGPHSSKHRV